MKFKVGDEVSIKNPGKVCPTYMAWAVKYELSDFKFGRVPRKNITGFIECVGMSHVYKTNMYGVLTQSGGFIVEKSGLKLINRANK